MTTRSWIAAGIGALCVLTAVVAASAVEKSTRNADIFSDTFTYDWKKNVFEFIGNCRVEVKGPDRATMTAPRMTGKLGQKGAQLAQITAPGPVHFEVTTKKDADGLQRRIVAACAGQAVFEGETSTITLTGGAEAQMTTIPATPDIEPAKFTGDKLIINLKTFTVQGERVHFEVELPPETAEEKKAP